jgi:signal transduction histidine kinase
MYFSTQAGEQPRLPFYKTFLCLICVFILIGNTVSLLQNLQSIKGANSQQGQASRVADRLQYLNVLVIDAESSMRGYFLHGSEAFLGPFRNAPEQISLEFDELNRLLADRPEQRKNLSTLRTLVDRKLASMDDLLKVYRQGGLSDIVKVSHMSDERAVMDEIRLLVVVMVKEQSEELEARNAAFYQEYQKAIQFGVGINAMAIIVLLLFYRLVRSSFFTRFMAERALKNTNDNLESMVATRTAQLSVLSRHLITVSEKEKAMLARELHDEMGANLTAISMDLVTVSEALKDSEPTLAAMLARARKSLIEAVELKRRIVEDLRPSLLDNLGLSAALHSYVDEFASVSKIDCETLVDGEVDAAGPMHAIAVFRIVQESLNNIAKYARARHVIVQLSREGENLSLQVIDNGVGIDLDAISKPKSHGLLGMRERALLLGGSLAVGRGVNGLGTCIDALIPLNDAASSETHPSAGGHTPSLPPYSIPPHTAPVHDGQ